MTPRTPSAALRFALVAVWLPVLLTAVALGIQLALLPQLPAVVAIHWGWGGHPDGFAPMWVQLAVTVAICLALPLLLALTSLPALRRGARGSSYRLMGSVAAGLSALGAVLFAGSALLQAGLADAADAPSIVPVMLLAFAAAFGVGLAAWFVQPKQDAVHLSSTAQPVPLAAGERAAWFATASLGVVSAAFITLACVLVTALAVAAWLLGPDVAAAVVITIVAVVLIAAALTTAVFHVRVDEEGLTVRSLAGVPTFRVPLDDIRSVSVSDVNPIGEFGGWGLRSTPGRFGVVVRTGPAIEVERRSGKRFVVTVPDAARGAGLLEALADRAASHGVGRKDA